MAFPFALESLLLYAGAAALFLIILLAAAVYLLSRKVKHLTMGKDGTDIATTLAAIASRTKTIEEFREELEGYLRTAEMRLRRSVQGVATVRFNPFPGEGSGGSQSFATALIDEDGNGVVISTIYARDRVGVFAKPLQKGVSQFELMEEESQAIKEALTRVSGSRK